MDIETINHIFFSCDMALDLWAKLARWWDLDIPICTNIFEWIIDWKLLQAIEQEEWDSKAKTGSFSSFDRAKRDEYLMDLRILEQKKTRSQNINGLNINELWNEDPEVISNLVCDHFACRFKETNHIRPKFRSNYFRRLDQQDVDLLEAPFPMDEVKHAVWNCCSSKAPGPDEVNFKFFKKYWEVV
ncbi:hypothetical protein Tco_1127735, partial [Tanacetum coccineum]